MTPHNHEIARTATRLDEAGFSPTEVVILNIMRRFCLSYARPEHQHWENAIGYAVKNFGMYSGSILAVTLLGVLQEMRCARKTTFRFMTPYCPSCSCLVTDCEELIIRSIRFVCENNSAGAKVDAMMLCEGHDTGPLLEAMRGLANVMPRHSKPLTGNTH